MEKTTLQSIRERSSHRKYLLKQLSEVELTAIVNAALQAPSAVNGQPWHFTVVQDQALLDRINATAAKHACKRPADTRSPRFDDPSFHVFYHAPTVVFVSARKGNYPPIDCGIAVQNMALAAESLHLGSVILGLPREAFVAEDKSALEQALHFPDGYEYAIAIAIGTPDDEKQPHEMDPGKVTYIR